MALFDIFKSKAENAIKKSVNSAVTQGINKATSAVSNLGNKKEKIVFSSLPSSFEEFASLPQAALSTPFETAAMTVLAFCYYPQNKDLALQMVNFLRGPRPLSGGDISFIADRFRDSDYVPRSYFEGSTPANDYTPAEPYTIIVSESPYSYQNEGYATLYITSGGADAPRSVQMRKAKDGKWYLWEQFILVGIRQPESANPWA
ncbi:MAG: hypothetical protein IJC04_11770 [Oscillospiraceae bacterium]|nr:hypothetical protein [Oscillospiraceae bacterium]